MSGQEGSKLEKRLQPLLAAGRLAEAQQLCRQRCNRKGGDVYAWRTGGLIAAQLGQLEEAAEQLTRALELAPADVEARLGLAKVYAIQEDYDRALPLYRRLLKARPDFAAGWFSYGMALRNGGQLEAAAAAFRRCVELEPARGEAALALALVTKYTRHDDLLERMEEQFMNPRTAPEQRMYLGFALGKAHDDLAEYPRAFACFRQANRLRRDSYDYDIAADRRLVEWQIEALDAPFFSERRDYGVADTTPVFIVGMPRSGTTLVEQILACHPAVHAAGELDDLRQVVLGGNVPLGRDRLAASLAGCDRERSMTLAGVYLERLRSRVTRRAAHITDKMPGNFMLLGMVQLLLPQARIIHCRRDPQDTCLSCYQQFFTGHQPFAYDLQELGQYYRLYAQLMDHWHAALPPGRILDVCYETLITEREAQTRRLLAHCGLEWHPACLAPHQAQRAVRTASVAQVRRPVYRDSMQAWRRYETELAPLRRALGDLAGRGCAGD